MLDLLFIFGAKYLFVLSLVIAGVYFLRQPWSMKKKMAIFGVVSLLLIYGVALTAGHLYYNPRPFVVGHFAPLIPYAADNGFPSDHVLLVSAIAAIVYFFNRRIGIVLWIITILVAISRVYVGVHHPIDVIASMLISLVSTSVVYIISKHVTFQQKH